MTTTVLLLAAAVCAQVDPISTLPSFPVSQRAEYLLYERDLMNVVTAARMARNHELLAARPQVAGTRGDAEQVDQVAAAFQSFGLTPRYQRMSVYLPTFVSAAVEIQGAEPVSIPLQEPALTEDPYSGNVSLMPGWNAWSASGEVTAEVVYANFASKADFERLAALGVDVRGKIVLARYGQLFRGHKARNAQQAGAAGLILYSDPAESGFVRGEPYPKGGWHTDRSIERGSILTLAYPGDPLTPYEESNLETKRLDPAQVDLPTIISQPIGWGGAREIISRMQGSEALPDGWKGGIDVTYRVTGGPDLKVRLSVKQNRGPVVMNNITAQLPGTHDNTRSVVIGCHRDAWGFGAADPHAGMAPLIEITRAFGLLSTEGRLPMRSITFAGWGAEEFGIIGSTEWVEARREFLTRNAVAYINLDMAAMGPDFGSSASPSLRRVIADAARSVPQPRDTSGRSVFDAWLARSEAAGERALEPLLTETEGGPVSAGSREWTRVKFGDLGGGSDHVAFLAHAGVASAGLGAGGSPGSSYHTNYDTVTWYRKVVGDDYAPAMMIARVGIALVGRLSTSPLIPLDHSALAPDMRRHLDLLAHRAKALGMTPRGTGEGAKAYFPDLTAAVDAMGLEADGARTLLDHGMEHEWLDWLAIRDINNDLMAAERAFLDPRGLPERPWYRNLYAAPDPDTGYGAWVLPGLRWAVERKDAEGLAAMEARYVAATEKVKEAMQRIQTRANTSMRMIKTPMAR